MIEYARKYQELGFKLLPCKPKEKIPANANGFHGATNDRDTIEAWWGDMPKANIAVSLIDMCVVDVDVHGNVNGFAALAEFDMPSTVTADTPTGGRHYYFKTKKKLDRKTNFRPGLDRLTNGYVLLPESIHPNGKPYTWQEHHSPWDLEMAELPDCFIEDKVPQATPWQQPEPRKVQDKSVILHRAELYLQKCEPAVQGMYGHNKLLYAASALVNGFDLSQGETISLLWRVYNPMCRPPWNQGNPSEAKDFERKVDEARKNCDRQPGWLIGDHIESKGNLQGAEIQKHLLQTIKQEVKKELKKETTTYNVTFKPTPPPKDVYDRMPKLIKEIKDYVDDCAIVPQPWLSLGAALSLCSVIMGNKWKFRGQYPNLFIVSSAPSSSGKENGRRCIKAILKKAGLIHMLGGESVTSDKAILRVIHNRKRVLYPLDEVGHFFLATKAKGAGSHMILIEQALMTLYSSAGTTYMGKDYADGNDNVGLIDNPHCCLYGTTTPSMLFKAFSSDDAKSGYMSRMLFFQSVDEPEPKEVSNYGEPSDDLCARIAKIAELPQVADGSQELLKTNGDIDTEIKELDVRQDAADLLRKYQVEMHSMKTSEHEEAIKSIVGKAFEIMLRVTIIATIANDKTIIEKNEVIWSCETVKHCVLQCVGASRDRLDQGTFGEDCEAVIKYLTKKSGWVKHSEILRNVRKVRKTKDLDQIRFQLEDLDVVETRRSVGARPCWEYKVI